MFVLLDKVRKTWSVPTAHEFVCRRLLARGLRSHKLDMVALNQLQAYARQWPINYIVLCRVCHAFTANKTYNWMCSACYKADQKKPPADREKTSTPTATGVVDVMKDVKRVLAAAGGVEDRLGNESGIAAIPLAAMLLNRPRGAAEVAVAETATTATATPTTATPSTTT